MGWGNYNVDRHPRVGIILDGLRDAGDHVVEINRPTRATTERRVRALTDPRTILSPIKTLSQSWWRLWRRARHERKGRAYDAMLIGYMGHFDVIVARMLFPRTTIVLDHLIFAADTARDRGEGGSLLRALLTVLDRWAIASASIVMVDTEEHFAALPKRARRKGVVVPVGARGEWIAAAEARVPRKAQAPLSVVFYGHFTPLQGAPVITEALRILDARGVKVRATMIGSGQDHESARALAGDAPIDWVDWVEPHELPALVATHDVCLGIFGTSNKAHNVVPNKVYQGLAAGCVVVTSDTAPQRRALDDVPTFVPPGDPEALADALADLAAAKPGVIASRGRASAALAQARFSPLGVATPVRDALLNGRSR